MFNPIKQLAKRLASRLYYYPFKRRAAATPPPPTDHVKPQDVIDKHGVDGLNAAAEEYFRRIDDPSIYAAKPFESLRDAPDILHRLGLMLDGLQLAETMTVLDFGAGGCWLSRLLNELGCFTISVDVSETALAIGRANIARSRADERYKGEARFVHFDGYRLPLEDDSVDRIACFDAFHHVPNPAEVMAELARVLAPGGIAGFSEPGRIHSQTPHSQAEMRSFTVLENDIRIEDIQAMAARAGFSSMRAKPLVRVDHDISYDELEQIVFDREMPRDTLQAMFETMTNEAVTFFLFKGEFVPDSRLGKGLAAELELSSLPTAVTAGKPFTVTAQIRNVGDARWLASSKFDIGVVRFGAHLCDQHGKVLDVDFHRCDLPHEIAPGGQLQLATELTLERGGSFELVFDLVAEGVCWFEAAGSTVARLRVEVVDAGRPSNRSTASSKGLL